MLATLASTETRDLRRAGHSTAAALTGGYHLAFLVGGGPVLAAITVAMTVLSPVQPAAEPGQGAAEAVEKIGGGEPAYGEPAWR